MIRFRTYAKTFAQEYCPILLFGLIVAVIYSPYLFGFLDLTGPGALTRRETWQFVLGPHFGWIDFYKNMGEFVGAMYHFGFFSPFMQAFRVFGITDPATAEYSLTAMYAAFTLAAAYLLYRRSFGYARWIAAFAAAIFLLNGSTFTTDVNTSENLASMFYLPLLMILAEGEFRGAWRKVACALLFGLEAANGHPQYILWQIVLVGAYLLYVKGWKAIIPYIGAIALSAIALVPSIGLTELVYRGYDAQQYVQPFALSWRANSLRDIPQMLTPFFPGDQIGFYVTPYYYTILLATFLFIVALPMLIRTWSEVPRGVRFFTVAAAFFFAGSFEGTFVQEALKHVPVLNMVLARNTYRYVYFYFFAVSFVVPYCIATYLRTKDQVRRFARLALWFGLAGIVGFCISTIVYVAYGDAIYVALKAKFVATRLPNVRGKYDPEYYFNLIRWYYDLYFSRLTLASVPGVLTALPYAGMAAWGYAVMRERIDAVRSVAWLAMSQTLIAALVFSAVLAQDARRVESVVPLSPETGVEQFMLREPDADASYVMSYGNYAGTIYMENLYKGGLDIRRWLNANEYDNFISYNRVPRTQNEIAPFRLFRDRLLATYIGFQLGDLFELNGSFRDDRHPNPAVLNPLSAEKSDLDSGKMARNLQDRLGILRAIGVRYVVSQYAFRVPGVRLVHSAVFPRKSDLLPRYAATLYLYELADPGAIVFVPASVRTAPFESVDMLDFPSVKRVYDDINYRGVSLVEAPGIATSTLERQYPGSAAVLASRDRDSILIRARMKRLSYVVVNTYYYPGWVATVDGSEEPALRANLNFVAVPVPAGDHTVRLRFDIRRMIKESL